MEQFKKEKVNLWQKTVRRLTALALAAALALGLAACDGSAVIQPPQNNSGIETTQPSAEENFQMHFIDVGQALSVLVECDGQFMLYDGGNVDDGSLVVS